MAGDADDVYDQDGLRSIHNHDFMTEPRFVEAYGRGVQAAGVDYAWHWRVHLGLWAARTAAHLPGDFVECGVNRGFLSSAIMRLLDWDTTGRHFYLLDTFRGIDERFVTADEREGGIVEQSRELLDAGFYVTGADAVRRNFAEWRNHTIIEGAVPDTLGHIHARQIAFLHLDMNCAPPEVAALEALWPRLVPGAPVLLDDYAYRGYEPQKAAIDALAERLGVAVAALPTGQGLLIKN